VVSLFFIGRFNSSPIQDILTRPINILVLENIAGRIFSWGQHHIVLRLGMVILTTFSTGIAMQASFV